MAVSRINRSRRKRQNRLTAGPPNLFSVYRTDRGSSFRIRSRRWLGFEQLEERTLLATITWINPTDGQWDIAENWDLARVPEVGDDVVIPDLASEVVVQFTSEEATVSSLVLHESLQLASGMLSVNGEIDGSGTLRVAGGTLSRSVVDSTITMIALSGMLDGVTLNGDMEVLGTVTITNGLQVAGTVRLGSEVSPYTGGHLTFSGTQTWSGPGEIVSLLSNGNAIYPAESEITLTLAPDLTIRGGTGQIGTSPFPGHQLSGVVIVNQGTIRADVSELHLNVSATGGFQNEGTLQAINGAYLSVGNLSDNTGEILSTGQVSTVNAGGTWTNRGEVRARIVSY